MELTAEQVATVRQDIADTEREIAQMKRELPGYELLAAAGDRLADMRASYRKTGIAERTAFVTKLRALLKARGETP